MRENRSSGSEGGEALRLPYPYKRFTLLFPRQSHDGARALKHPWRRRIETSDERVGFFAPCWLERKLLPFGILAQFILDRRREKKKVNDREKKAKDKQVFKEKDKELKELKVEKLEKELVPTPWWKRSKLFGDRAA